MPNFSVLPPFGVGTLAAARGKFGKSVATAPVFIPVMRVFATIRLSLNGETGRKIPLRGKTPTMKFAPVFNTLRLFVLMIAIASICTGFTGCTIVGRTIGEFNNAVHVRQQEWRDLARIREDTREELAKQREVARKEAAERDVQEALIASKRQQLEAQFCQANQEALERRVKSNIRETVESKVAFNVVQGLEVGELEVDMEALKKLIEEREQPPPEALERPREALAKKPCECCDRPCGCKLGLLRRLCPHCRNKPCEAKQSCGGSEALTKEEKCGGPEALTRAEQEPLRRPLRPTEIPLKLPVRLSFGMEQPAMEAARIRREVPGGPPEALKRPPCDGNGAPCDAPGCPVHGSRTGNTQRPAVPPEYQDPPVPVAEPIDSVRQSTPMPPIEGTQVGFFHYPKNGFFWHRPDLESSSETFRPARWWNP
jgi:hypothetical protein